MYITFTVLRKTHLFWLTVGRDVSARSAGSKTGWHSRGAWHRRAIVVRSREPVKGGVGRAKPFRILPCDPSFQIDSIS